MKTELYLIKPFTNMHVGSGKTNSGIVDNTIQRDVLTGYPIINSTSLKGALREYVKLKIGIDITNTVFGKANEKKNGKEDNQIENKPGTHIFFSAHLLTLPARSDKTAFLNVTTPSIIEDFLKQSDRLDKTIINETTIKTFEKLSSQQPDKAVCFDKKIEDCIVEFYDIKTSFLQIFSPEELSILRRYLGPHFVLMNNKLFSDKIANKLPVIARNCLENGQSTNLWYEEIIPRETVFYTFIAASQDNWNKFNKTNFHMKSIQIGANSSVGYGYSEIYQIEEKGGPV